MRLLADLLLLLLGQSLEVTLRVLQLLDELSLLKHLLLGLMQGQVGALRNILLLSIVPRLHLLLLHEHLLLDFVDTLLLFNLHLLNDASIVLTHLV